MIRPVRSHPAAQPVRLTEAELRIMKAVWTLGQGTVHDILRLVNEQSASDFAYTTVSTMIRILEQKGALRCEKQRPAHLFVPLLSRGEYESSSVKELLANVFENDATPMLCRLVESGAVSSEDLRNLEALLVAHKREVKP